MIRFKIEFYYMEDLLLKKIIYKIRTKFINSNLIIKYGKKYHKK